MNDQGAFVAALLDNSRKAYAAGAILRLQEASPDSARFVESWGFSALVADAEIRLQHLAEALACGRTELFVLDAGWLAQTFEARGVPQETLVATLTCLRDELADSLPDKVAATVEPYFAAALERLAEAPVAPSSVIEQSAPHVDLAREFLVTVLEGDRHRSEALVLAAHDQGVSVADLHLHVIAKAQAEVGRLWQSGEVHVADEHLCSRIVEDVLAQLRTRIQCSSDKGLTAITASVAGNLHDIGAHIVADHFEMHGWRSIFLGANTPKDDLVQAVVELKPDLIALSVGLGINLRTAAETIQALREAAPGLPILVGGQPFGVVPQLWSDVGADACALDAANAVEVGAQLVAR